MSDHAEKIRRALIEAEDQQAIYALDAYEAERQQAQEQAEAWRQTNLHLIAERQQAQEEAAKWKELYEGASDALDATAEDLNTERDQRQQLEKRLTRESQLHSAARGALQRAEAELQQAQKEAAANRAALHDEREQTAYLRGELDKARAELRQAIDALRHEHETLDVLARTNGRAGALGTEDALRVERDRVAALLVKLGELGEQKP